MHCYSCDKTNASVFDGPTGRYYCSTCFHIIMDLLTNDQDDDNIIEYTSEEELYDDREDQGNASDLPAVWTP
jgi:hypothetical protein